MKSEYREIKGVMQNVGGLETRMRPAGSNSEQLNFATIAPKFRGINPVIYLPSKAGRSYQNHSHSPYKLLTDIDFEFRKKYFTTEAILKTGWQIDCSLFYKSLNGYVIHGH